MMHVVLFEPDIPWNTGNIGRTCLATGSALHLVGRMGFELSSNRLKRAGLDYWKNVKWTHYADWDRFLSATPGKAPLFFFSKKGGRSFWEAKFLAESYLIFGCETRGLPDRILEHYRESVYAIPMRNGGVRSLNLSTAVGVALYEAIRQSGFHDLHP